MGDFDTDVDKSMSMSKSIAIETKISKSIAIETEPLSHADGSADSLVGGNQLFQLQGFRPLPPAAFSSMRPPKAVLCEVQCLHFGTLGRSRKGTRGSGTRFSLIWSQFWDPPPYKNHQFYFAKLTFLSFDGSMSILS